MHESSKPLPDVRRLSGVDVRDHLDAVAALRIAVFGDWPYLYAGDAGYEREYLARYADSADSVFVLVFDGDRVVGASTGLPLADDIETLQAPFRAHGIDVAAVFYFGESVLLRDYRGLGFGHAFFDHREAHARALRRFDRTAFCSVERDDGDPRAPAGHRGNAAFWSTRGYARRPGMTMRLPWREIGDVDETGHTLTVWTRPLERDA